MALPPIVNVSTRKPEPLKDDQIADAIMTGTHAYPKGAMIEMRDQNNEPVEVPAENVQRAIQAGFKPYGPMQAAVDEYVAENDNIKGALKVGVGQFLDEALGGIPELSYDLTADDLKRAQKEGLKKNFELLNDVTGVGGGVAGVFLGPAAWLGRGAGTAGRATEAAIAAKLGAAAGEEVGKRSVTTAAKQIAAKIAAKTGGGAVEGAIVAAPHALTELSLGDPELAAEALMWGGGLGALMGGTMGTAGELMGLSTRAAKKGYEWLGGKAPTAENLRDEAMRLGLGIDKEMIEHRLKYKDRMDANAGRTSYDIAEDVDAVKNKYLAEEDDALEAWKSANKQADESYRTMKYDLAKDKPSDELGDEIMQAVGSIKQRQGELSAAADRALEDATLKLGRQEIPITLRKQDIQALITSEIKKIIPRGAKAAPTADLQATVDELMSLNQRLKDNYGKELTGVEVRDLVRTYRDSNVGAYGQSVGQFNTKYERAMKGIAEGLNNRLKSKLEKYGYDEFGKITKQMHEISKNLDKMDDLFGREVRAGSTLRGYTGPRFGYIQKALAEFDGLHGTDFVPRLQKYVDAKNLLVKGAREGEGELKKVLIPAQYQTLLEAQQRLEAVVSRNDAFRRLGKGSSHPSVLNMMRKNANPDTEKALQALSELEGREIGANDFLSQIEDRRMNDAFEASRINGSRRVNTGAAVGAAAGGLLGSMFGPVGMAAGAVAGAVMDVDGGKIAKKIIDGDSFLGPLFIEKAMGQGGRKLDRIGEVLGKMKDRATKGGRLTPSPVDGARLTAIRSMVDHLVEPSKKEDREEVNSKLNDKFSEWVSNPELLNSDIAAVASQVGETGAPEISGVAATKLVTAVTYLNSQMPKPPRSQSPFAPRVRWKPSSFEMKAFEEKMEAAVDPFSVIDHLENGTLTKNHMEAIKTIYPALHTTIQKRVYDSILSGEVVLGYTDRMKLSLLLDLPLDESMRNITLHQKTFAADPNGTQTVAGPKRGDSGFRANVNLAGQYNAEKY